MKKTIRKQQKHNLTTEKPNCDHQGSDRARQSGDRILSLLHEHVRHRCPIQGAVLEELHMKKLAEEAGIHRTYLGHNRAMKQYTSEFMTVAEFQSRHQDPASAHSKPQVSSDIVLRDVNGIPLAVEDTISVEYHDGLPVAYCLAREIRTGENTFVRSEGEYRKLSPS